MNWNGNVNNTNNKSNSNSNNQAFPALDVHKMQNMLDNYKYTYKDILNAYLDCRKHKRNTSNALEYEPGYELWLKELLEQINNETYEIGRSIGFAVTKPKTREIWAADFKDRVVHHLVYNKIGPYIEKRFIEDSYSCIKGRGNLAAFKRAESFCRSITQNWSKSAWVIQVDIANYFCSINKHKLIELLESYIGNYNSNLTARLIYKIVMNDPTENDPCVKNPKLMQTVPKRKSLFYTNNECGLPVGNLTSQFFSNVYLDPFDKFSKHVLKIKYYVRYVDDILILSKDKEPLYEWLERMDEFLKTKLYLNFHPNKIKIKPIYSGINFVGGIILPFRTYPRRMNVSNAFKVAKHLKKMDSSMYFTEKSIAPLNSYLGLFSHTDSYNLRKYLCEQYVSDLIFYNEEYRSIHYK